MAKQENSRSKKKKKTPKLEKFKLIGFGNRGYVMRRVPSPKDSTAPYPQTFASPSYPSDLNH